MKRESIVHKDVTGIIINILEYQENDLIVSFLTKEYGFVQCVVKGANKSSNKSFYLIKLFNELRFDMLNYRPQELAVFKSGTIINSCDYTSLKYTNLNMLMLVSESLYKIRNAEVRIDQDFYKVIALVLKQLQLNESANWFYLNYFLLVILKLLGLELVLDRCIYCGSQSNIKSFSNYELGFVCTNCVHLLEDESNSDKEYLNYLYNLNKHQLIKVSPDIEKEVLRLLTVTLYDRSGILLNSASML